jgi:integrase
MSKWALYMESGRWVVRRWEDGKYKRLPVPQYRHIRDNDVEMKAFVIRLNAAITTKEAVTFKHAFISPDLLEEYRQYLVASIPNQKNALCQYNYLIDYFLNFFIGKLNLADPRQWFKVHQTQWAAFLLSKEAPASVSVKRKIIQEANRFMKWLAIQRPGEVVAIKFEPISRAKFSTLKAQQKLKDKRNRYIKPEEWKEIEKKLPARIKSAVCLCYYYGLRRSEALGLQLPDVRKEYLSVERQQLQLGKFAILKGKKMRRAPHWFIGPAQTYKLINELVLMSPDTLTEEFAKVEPRYHLHDLRATFITRALQTHSPRDIQLAVGHENLVTTMGYTEDHRDFGDDIFIPEAG